MTAFSGVRKGACEKATSVTRLGKLYAKVLGSGPSRRTLLSQRSQLDDLAQRFENRKRALNISWAVAAAAACGLALLCIALLEKPSDALSANWKGKAFASGELQVRDGQHLPLQFSDGSEVILKSDTRARLDELNGRHAQLTLNDGSIDARINRSTQATWDISAGPYRVRVVGTQFTVDWRDTSQSLRVRVHEGKVKVFGGNLPASGVPVEAGSELSQTYQRDSERKVVPATHTERPAQKAPRAARSEKASTASERPRTERTSSEPGWHELAEQGKYTEALSQARALGFTRLTRELQADELLKLGNTARYGGDPDSARRALTSLRARFPGTSAASLAALYLARLAEDIEHKPRLAAHYLRAFLRESPNGQLAADARANLLSILLSLDETQQARSVALDYLRYHPRGPHAEKARSLVSQAARDGQ